MWCGWRFWDLDHKLPRRDCLEHRIQHCDEMVSNLELIIELELKCEEIEWTDGIISANLKIVKKMESNAP